MKEKIYQKLAKVLDTIPNGFPTTDSGIEIELLKKVFASNEADWYKQRGQRRGVDFSKYA